jgi:hypothetical protein
MVAPVEQNISACCDDQHLSSFFHVQFAAWQSGVVWQRLRFLDLFMFHLRTGQNSCRM